MKDVRLASTRHASIRPSLGSSRTRWSGTRRCLKAAIFGACVLLLCPLAALTWLEKRLSRSEQWFVFFGQSLALLPGLPGTYMRGAYYFSALDACSWETSIGFGSMFTRRGGSIGARASIGCYCVLGNADIGAQVMMGSRVSVPSGKRQHLDAKGQLSASGGSFEQVGIGRGCWIGEGTIILADVGSDCIVSAGSVVTHEMPSGTLVGGNPAKVLKILCDAASAHEGA